MPTSGLETRKKHGVAGAGMHNYVKVYACGYHTAVFLSKSAVNIYSTTCQQKTGVLSPLFGEKNVCIDPDVTADTGMQAGRHCRVSEPAPDRHFPYRRDMCWGRARSVMGRGAATASHGPGRGRICFGSALSTQPQYIRSTPTAFYSLGRHIRIKVPTLQRLHCVLGLCL